MFLFSRLVIKFSVFLFPGSSPLASSPAFFFIGSAAEAVV